MTTPWPEAPSSHYPLLIEALLDAYNRTGAGSGLIFDLIGGWSTLNSTLDACLDEGARELFKHIAENSEDPEIRAIAGAYVSALSRIISTQSETQG